MEVKLSSEAVALATDENKQFLDRKKQRKALLKDLYEHHFAHNGKEKDIDNKELRDDPELSLAYDYLEEKEYIRYVNIGGQRKGFKITTLGIDIIENGD